MRGDGFVYLVKRTQIQYWQPPSTLANFDQGATLMAKLLTSLYGPNISLYYWTELFFVVAISILFFIFIFVVTKSIILTFIATLIFSVNYFGNFNMLCAYGAYSFFLERIVNMVGIIPSLIFLHLFLEKKKWKYFTISTVFYFISVGLSHWFILFTPAFCLYPVSWFLFNEKNKKKFWHYLFISLSYIALSGLFILLQQINQSGLGPKKWGFIEFLLNPGTFQYPEKIIRQLVYWTIYVPYNHLPGVKSAIMATPYIGLLYLLANVVLYRFLNKDKKYLVFWSFISCLLILYLNAYFGQYDILDQYGANRYLYFPTFLLAVFWSTLIWLFFFRKRKILLYGLGTVLLGLFYLINVSLIDFNFKLAFSWDHPTKLLYDYMVANNNKYPKGTLVITPNREINVYETEFFNDFLGKGKVIYVFSKDPQFNSLMKTKSPIYEIDYNAGCDCVLEKKIR